MRNPRRKSFFGSQERVMLTTTDFIPVRSRGVKIAFGIFFGAAVLAGIYLLLFSDYFLVQSATVVGNSKVSFEEVQKSLSETESASGLILIPKNHLFFVSSETFAKKIKETNFVVDQVTIKKSFPNTLRVEVVEKMPAIIWQQNNTQFYVDPRGHVIERVPLDAKADVPLVINQVSREIPSASDFVIHPEAVERIVTAHKLLPSRIGVNAQTTIMPTGFALEFTVQTSEGWSIIFDRERSIQSQLDGLQSMLQNEIGEKRTFLSYVDLRVENTGYFK